MAKRLRIEERVLRRQEDVTPPYLLSPYEDLQESAGLSWFDADTRSRHFVVMGTIGIPRRRLGELVIRYGEDKHIFLGCE